MPHHGRGRKLIVEGRGIDTGRDLPEIILQPSHKGKAPCDLGFACAHGVGSTRMVALHASSSAMGTKLGGMGCAVDRGRNVAVGRGQAWVLSKKYAQIQVCFIGLFELGQTRAVFDVPEIKALLKTAARLNVHAAVKTAQDRSSDAMGYPAMLACLGRGGKVKRRPPTLKTVAWQPIALPDSLRPPSSQ